MVETLQSLGVPLKVAARMLKLEQRCAALEKALREVRRCGQHEPARRIINDALGDTWEQETGYGIGSPPKTIDAALAPDAKDGSAVERGGEHG